MKPKITDEIKELFAQSVNWAKLEVEYIKLTAAEKMVMMVSAMILGAVFMVLLLPVFIMFMFALADVFKMMMAPALAYLCVGGIVLVCLALLYLLRVPLIVNPVARFMTRILIERHNTPKSN